MNPDRAPVTSPIPTISSRGSAPGTAILWAVFHPASASDPLQLHAYDADDVRANLFSAQSPMYLDVDDWVPLGNHAGNSFQVPSVIHGKLYAGSKDHFVAFGPQNRPHCSLIVDCGGSVTLYCGKDPDSGVFELQRLQNSAWRAAEGFGTRDLQQFVYLWDYPSGDSATYRVCSAQDPEACTPAILAKIDRRPCHIATDDCGRPGRPPCFLNRPWPVSAGQSITRRGATNR